MNETGGTAFSVACVFLLFGLLGLCTCGESRYSHLIDTKPFPFDFEQLFEMDHFGSFDRSRDLNNDLVVIMYFSNLTCSTCTNRELENLNSWREKYSSHVDFALVVHGWNRQYLSSIRRVGKVIYPIFMEGGQGALGFDEDRITIAILDRTREQIIARYYPITDPASAKTIDQLEDILIDQLKERGLTTR